MNGPITPDQGEREFVSVITPVYNGEDGVRDLLEALSAQNYPRDRFEVLIVDNGSTDRTMAVVKAYADANPDIAIRLLTEHDRRGSYAARNKAIEVARGSILAFTDGDCRPDSNWIAAGTDALLTSGAERAGGAIEFVFRAAEPNPWEHVDSLSYFRQAQYVASGWSVTANLFVRSSVMKVAGGFRDDLLSGGDVEFGLRMRDAGARIVYAPDAIVRHNARASHHEVTTKVRRVARGMEQSGGHGRVRAISLRDFTPRRRLPSGASAGKPGLARRLTLIALFNYLHYLRLYTRLRARMLHRKRYPVSNSHA